MTYLGDFAEDATVRRWFNTVDQNGAPVTIGGTAAAQVYKDGSVSQTTAGVTITEDFDGVTGLHLLAVDMSADANYTTGAEYAAVISVGTADSVSIVGGVLSQWSCENRTAVGVSIRDAAITANTFDTGVLATDADIADAVWDEAIGDHATAGSTGEAITTIDTVVDAILVDTGTSGVLLAANAIGEAVIQDNAITAAKIATGAIDADALATDAVAEIADAVWDEATSGHTNAGTFGEQLKTDVDAILADTAELQTDWVDGGRLDLLLDQAATAASVPSAATIADAVLDEALSGHATAGTLGKAVTDILAGGSAPTAAAIADAVWTEAIADHSGEAGSTAEALNNAGAAGTVSTAQVSNERTWFAEEYRSRNIVTVGNGFAGTFAVVPDLNPETTIASISSVAITGAASVTASSSAVRADKQAAHFTVPALTTSGTYTVVVKVLTNDSQTIPTTCTLKVV